MSSNLVERINALSDTEAVTFFEYFNQSLFDGLVNDFDELIEGIPAEIKSMPEFAEIDQLSADDEAKIEGEEAVTVARSILGTLAANQRFSPLLEKALETYGNLENIDELLMGGDKAKEILAVGLAASMILLAASATSFQIKGDWGEVSLDKSSPNTEVVKALVKPIIKNFQLNK